jgi:hypothetical protein
MSGWRVLVDTDLKKTDPKVTKDGLNNLREALRSVEKKLPKEFVKFSKRDGLKIFISPSGKMFGRTGMFFSPKDSSSYRSGLERIMNNSIVIIDESTLMKPEKITYFLIHEFAHYYHFNVLGYSNNDIWYGFYYAKNSADFDKVSAYALNNHMEFFAELSAIFFTSEGAPNNLGPHFNKLLEKLWGTSRKRYNIITITSPNIDNIRKKELERNKEIFPLIK